ncbi:Os05g0440150 [Oryza sativa Japonica Group]|uniref:Os05g0440150 protein n=1 Tax=Oryza sativa subsp. japonica TaxID=39947 RepID=A0A0N7KKV0_ORYSJ|nr:hypothetical protein EE612_029765 [Oryza sativa]BAS94233.1 Os05g0440150 [Oryza sativa Japonica Group]
MYRSQWCTLSSNRCGYGQTLGFCRSNQLTDVLHGTNPATRQPSSQVLHFHFQHISPVANVSCVPAGAIHPNCHHRHSIDIRGY